MWWCYDVPTIVFFVFAAFSKKPEETANDNPQNNQQQQEERRVSGLGLSTFEGVKLFLTKGIGGMCFPMIEDDDEQEPEHEHQQ